MKWFKHEATANMDAKLQEVLLDYGLEGYGLYWYCLELIAKDVEPEKLTFELEHDCRIIARNTGSTAQKVQEMMTRFAEIGLFENSSGVITCLKLAKVSDDYTAKLVRKNPPKIPINTSVRQTPTLSEKVPLDKKRIEENREDKNKQIVVKPKAKKEEFSWSIDLTDQQKQEIKGIRKASKKPLTQLALNAILKEFEVARISGIDYQESIEIWAVRGWVAYKADWALNHKGQNNGKQTFGSKATLTVLGDTDF